MVLPGNSFLAQSGVYKLTALGLLAVNMDSDGVCSGLNRLGGFSRERQILVPTIVSIIELKGLHPVDVNGRVVIVGYLQHGPVRSSRVFGWH